MQFHCLQFVRIIDKYVFFSNGLIYNLKQERFVSPSCNSYKGKSRYPTIKIFARTKYVHRILGELFLGLRSSIPAIILEILLNLVVDHVNGLKKQYNLGNLRICSQSKNCLYSLENRGLIS